MVNRATFIQIFLASALLVIICAYGLAVAKDKLVLKYLPVDHDIEMVRQENNTTTNRLRVYQTNSSTTVDIVKGHIGCLTCREFDQYGGAHCPDCCLYGVNNSSIHCQNSTDTACPNVGPIPFPVNGTACPACQKCNTTFARPGVCKTGQCSKYPETLKPCFAAGCPESTRPANRTGYACVNSTLEPHSWTCAEDGLKSRKSCVSLNTNIPSCQNFSNVTTAYTKTVPSAAECIAAGFANGTCWKYASIPEYENCITHCNADLEYWEMGYYEYNNGTVGKKICPAGNCTSGFNQNCAADACKKKIAFGCGNYTVAACEHMEEDYRELLLGTIAKAFVEIDPNFRYKFVARSGERYMISWQVLCDIIEGDQKYNLYTMVKVWDQEFQNAENPVYQSIVHQKALGSTFYINAQTGMDPVKAPGLKPGRAYIIKLYYFLPNDGETPLEVDISLMQLILYRTKN
jgi:hypothetical protein